MLGLTFTGIRTLKTWSESCSILLGEYGFYGDGGKSEGTADEDLGGKKTYTSPTWRGGGVVCPKDQNAMESTFTQ